jgi:branched-chain amino acid transport system substrate-binding protein
VVAAKTIGSLADLDGKTVAVGSANGGTFVTAIAIFERLDVRPHFLYIEQRLALERLKRGEIDAVVAVEGKPLQEIAHLDSDELHFVPIDYPKPLQEDYLPTQLTAEDYPNLITAGRSVDTVAVSAVLAAYNWAPRTDRYRRLELVVNALFSKIKELQRPPFHPKWREVALNAPLPGWTRFAPAQTWLDQHKATPTAAAAAPQAQNDVEQGKDLESLRQFLDWETRNDGQHSEDREALFRQFLDWRKRQPVGAR